MIFLNSNAIFATLSACLFFHLTMVIPEFSGRDHIISYFSNRTIGVAVLHCEMMILLCFRILSSVNLMKF